MSAFRRMMRHCTGSGAPGAGNRSTRYRFRCRPSPPSAADTREQEVISGQRAPPPKALSSSAEPATATGVPPSLQATEEPSGWPAPAGRPQHREPDRWRCRATQAAASAPASANRLHDAPYAPPYGALPETRYRKL